MEDTRNTKTIYVDNSGVDEIDIKSTIERYLFYWKWLIFGIVLAILMAFLYLRYTTHTYEAKASILINDKEKTGLASEMSAFKDISLFGDTKTSLDTEIGVLKSRTLFEEVVSELGINISFIEVGKIKDGELYRENVPIKINFLVKDSILRDVDTSFTIKPISKTKFILGQVGSDVTVVKSFGNKIKLSFGEITVTPANIKDVHIEKTIIVKLMPVSEVAKSYREKILIQPENKKSSLLILSLKDPVPEKASDILNTLIKLYNNNAVKYKKIIAENTDKFINERIADISVELENVDKGVEEFKKKNKVTDIGFEAGLDLSSNSELRKRIADLNSQIKMTDYVLRHIRDNPDKFIPANLGLNDSKTNESTANYNQLLMERDRIMKSSSKLNPTVINLNNQLSNMRQSIEQGLMNLKSSLTFSLNEAQNQMYRLNAKKSKTPVQQRELQDIMRKQQIIESLYLYLLQKREENAISLGIPVPNAKIVDVAKAGKKPIAPQPKLVFAAAIILGLLVPLFFISIKLMLDTKIHSKDDIEKMLTAPVIGEIPSTKSKEKLVLSIKDNHSIAESFRLLRTNTVFMLSRKGNEGKIIFITSTLSSEGKTFISINLAASLALLNKKVLLIGADVRKPKFAKYLKIKRKEGLSEYLINPDLSFKDVVISHKQTGVDIVLSGSIPPNPSELLTNGRFDEMIEYGKSHYDYVIVDTAPVNIVTDTLILGHHADLFIYVVRANYLDKRLLNVAKGMYENKRLPNMTILVNDVDYKKKAYGYGYGYAYGQENKKSILKRVFDSFY